MRERVGESGRERVGEREGEREREGLASAHKETTASYCVSAFDMPDGAVVWKHRVKG